MKTDYSKDELTGISTSGQDILKHYGVKFRSGRYPYGSGEDPHQHVDRGSKFEIREKYRKQGLTEQQIARKMGISQNELRSIVTIGREEKRRRDRETVIAMKGDGKTIKDMMEKTGQSESWVRNVLSKGSETQENTRKQTSEISNLLKDRVDEVKYLDIGKGVETQVGVSEVKLNTAVRKLTDSGEYTVHNLRVDQATNPKSYNKTTVKVLTKSNVDIKEVYDNLDKVRAVDFYTESGDSKRIQRIQTPKSIDWNRVKIRYAIPEGQKGHGGEEDGQSMDGAMFIRPGVKDLSLGNSKYAQVRIAVGNTHYLKGMALYGDPKDFPDGVDIIFNTNKTKDKSPEKVLKELKGPLDSPNPFSATIKRQSPLLDKNGNPVIDKEATAREEKRLGHKLSKPIYKNSAVNIVNEEGDWQQWSKALSSQFLAKQPEPVVRERLNATLKQTKDELEEIARVNNPVIKKKLLESYISSVESKQVHIKAAAPSGFQGHVILPVPKMKENEVFAPNYPDGTRVILVRYPHAGRFEIPELIVNNKGPGRKIIGNQSKDAIGIHPKVAAKMSGADFDGDAAYVIPNNEGRYKSEKSLKGLKGFEPSQYGGTEMRKSEYLKEKQRNGTLTKREESTLVKLLKDPKSDPMIYKDDQGTFEPMSKASKQRHMGIVSNLITDMTLQNATPDEMARAVRHSMVVIDAEKHKLNYKRSAKENRIEELKEKYMMHTDRIDYSKLKYYNKDTRQYEKVTDLRLLENDGKTPSKGASTVLSRRKKDITVGGYLQEGNVYQNGEPTGKTKLFNRGNHHKVPITNLLDDASVYLNPNSTKVEKDYVNYINSLKVIAKSAQQLSDEIKMPVKDPKAAKIYAEEVESLKQKLMQSKANAPRERRAQMLANVNIEREIKNRESEGEEIPKDELKKLRNQALNAARDESGAKRYAVKITDDEWDAIQANAVSPTLLREITKHMDDDELKTRATPRNSTVLTGKRADRAQAMINNGYSISQIATQLGVSPSTISRYISQEGG